MTFQKRAVKYHFKALLWQINAHRLYCTQSWINIKAPQSVRYYIKCFQRAEVSIFRSLKNELRRGWCLFASLTAFCSSLQCGTLTPRFHLLSKCANVLWSSLKRGWMRTAALWGRWAIILSEGHPKSSRMKAGAQRYSTDLRVVNQLKKGASKKHLNNVCRKKAIPASHGKVREGNCIWSPRHTGLYVSFPLCKVWIINSEHSTFIGFHSGPFQESGRIWRAKEAGLGPGVQRIQISI